MAKKEMSPQYLSEFCMELALLVRAGISVDDGLEILSEDFDDPTGFLAAVSKAASAGSTLTEALSQSDLTPDYMLNMVRLGERAGRLEATLLSLSEYYERRGKLTASIRDATVYPCVLIIMLAAVVAVLVTKVLPIFAEVFSQMGAEMNPLANGFLVFGRWLSGASAVIVWVLVAIIALAPLVFLVPAARLRVKAFFRGNFGGRAMFANSVSAQFASAMTTAISSGLDPQESVELAGKVVSGVKKTDAGVQKCLALLSKGETFEKSLSQSGIFSARDSRLLALGIRTGTSESVMAEIARRSQERALTDIDAGLAKVEPTMVVIISVIVGAVLLSVMLPLMGIMSSIG